MRWSMIKVRILLQTYNSGHDEGKKDDWKGKNMVGGRKRGRGKKWEKKGKDYLLAL